MMELLTTMLVIITAAYAFLTYRILRANENVVGTIKEQINSSIRPYVYFDLVTLGNLINARVKNTGATAAYKVSVTVAPQLRVSLQNKTFDARTTSAVITLLPPGKEVEEFIDSYIEFQRQNPSLKYSGRVQYSDVNGRGYAEPFEIDLTILTDLTHVRKQTIPDELKEISSELKRISRILQESRWNRGSAND